MHSTCTALGLTQKGLAAVGSERSHAQGGAASDAAALGMKRVASWACSVGHINLLGMAFIHGHVVPTWTPAVHALPCDVSSTRPCYERCGDA